jgi:hypothetical protein
MDSAITGPSGAGIGSGNEDTSNKNQTIASNSDHSYQYFLDGLSARADQGDRDPGSGRV